MFELTMSEVRHRAGISDLDHPLEADMKFSAWMGKKKYRVIDHDLYHQQALEAQADGIEILIIKGK